MSVNILKIIPINPSLIPNKTQQDKAKEFLLKSYVKDSIEFIITETIEFVDPGEFFESTACNLCGELIETEDWQNAMDNSYEEQFTDLEFITPCCKKKTSLNDLHYNSAAGFAKFMITITDTVYEFPEKDIAELQQILQTPLRLIWSRY